MHVIFECVDVWRMIIAFVEFDDSCRLRETCRVCCEMTKACDWEVAEAYARNILHDSKFWERALSRPIDTARPQRTWHQEMLRIRNLERFSLSRYTASDFYMIWNIVDRVGLRGTCDHSLHVNMLQETAPPSRGS